MDKELSIISAKLDAQQRSLNALAEVQGDHTRRLTRIEGMLSGVEGRLGSVEADLSTVKEDVATVKTGVHAILDLLDANLAKRSLAGRLASRFTRSRDGADGNA